MGLPGKPIRLKEGLRIDFRTPNGKPLNYIRFENENENDDCPTYLGALDASRAMERRKLIMLRDAITYLLKDKTPPSGSEE